MSPWARTDDTFHDDPRVIDVSLSALGLLWMALVWSCRHVTEGFVSRVFVHQRAGELFDLLVTELIEKELFTTTARDGRDGFLIAAFIVDLQQTKAEVEQRREDARKRQRRRRSKNVTRDSQRDNDVTHAAVTLVSQPPVPSRPVLSKKNTGTAVGTAVSTLRPPDIVGHDWLCKRYAEIVREDLTATLPDRLDALKAAMARERVTADPSDLTKAQDAVERVGRLIQGPTEGRDRGFSQVAGCR